MKNRSNSVGRPSKCRFVKLSPIHNYYKPRGIPMTDLDEVSVTIDEFEAIRLADYKGLYHKQAAEKMGISRQTFSRILSSAHKQISDGLINGKAIKIEGGNYSTSAKKMNHNCEKHPSISKIEDKILLEENMSEHQKKGIGSGGECVCPKCEVTVPHKQGIPCQETKCLDCGAKMLRVGSEHHKQWLEKKISLKNENII